jgi:hypothetical protein
MGKKATRGAEWGRKVANDARGVNKAPKVNFLL